MSEMLAKGDEILSYIPQRYPFVMIDTLLDCNETITRTAFLIKEDNLFTVNGYFTEPGLMENMAQSAAAGVGYYFKKQNIPIPVGYIGAIKNFEIFKLPEAGLEISTEIKKENEVLGITIISGVITCGDTLIAKGEMRIFIDK